MEFLDLAATLLVLAAAFGYLNLKIFKLPTTIGIMLIGLLLSVVVLVLRDALPFVPAAAEHFVESIDFNKALMEGMLSFLLFAGALHVNLGNLLDQKKLVAIMASFGVVFSTFLIGGVSWLRGRTMRIPEHGTGAVLTRLANRTIRLRSGD